MDTQGGPFAVFDLMVAACDSTGGSQAITKGTPPAVTFFQGKGVEELFFFLPEAIEFPELAGLALQLTRLAAGAFDHQLSLFVSNRGLR